MMLERHALPVARIRVPAKRARTLEPDKVAAIAEDWMENGQKTPIRCRVDPKAPGEFILIEGYHRLEAARALGEETILGFLVRARVH
ncbi:MAG: ParB N-terminal domain-containing protein [Paracoccaceae bacterium]